MALKMFGKNLAHEEPPCPTRKRMVVLRRARVDITTEIPHTTGSQKKRRLMDESSLTSSPMPSR